MNELERATCCLCQVACGMRASSSGGRQTMNAVDDAAARREVATETSRLTSPAGTWQVRIMSEERTAGRRVGFTCSYAPLPLIEAAGFVPFRILPTGDSADQAGSVLHDNLCPHVKRVLDRAMDADVPDMAGVVLVDSCDAMRRLADAWRSARPDVPVLLIDLPVSSDGPAQAYLAQELERAEATLSIWASRPIEPADVAASAGRLATIGGLLGLLYGRAQRGTLPGGRAGLQRLFNDAVTGPTENVLERLRELVAAAEPSARADRAVPVYLFGNVLPDPSAFELIESCGARVVGDDLCTGDKQLSAWYGCAPSDAHAQRWRWLARILLERPACARTLHPAEPDRLARQVIEGARASGAVGVISHVMKFCDPYLARLPAVRAALERAGLPLLVLEGDCTMRSLGQHATRIEAFVEMLASPLESHGPIGSEVG